MECGDSYRRDQFRATRTWNAIVTAVREELPVGRHRKGLKHIENCFSGDEAVSWTLHYLEQNCDILFGTVRNNGTNCTTSIHRTEITREKVALLLQKFVEQKIIEDVYGRGEQFRDSSRQLYTFNKGNTASLSTFTSSVASNDDNANGHIAKSRNGSLIPVSPTTIQSATCFVKVALVSFSSQKVRREPSSTLRT